MTTGTAAAAPRLSFGAIVCIAANTLNGPGLTTLPATAFAAGKITQVAILAVSTLLTCYCCKRLCILMWTKHHNNNDSMDSSVHTKSHHNPVLEDSDMVALSNDAFGKWSNTNTTNTTGSNATGTTRIRQLAALAMIGCALALALAQQMLTAKIADALIVASFGSACGISVNGQWHCTSQLSMQPFSAMDTTTSSDHTADESVVGVGGYDYNYNNNVMEGPEAYAGNLRKDFDIPDNMYRPTKQTQTPVALLTGGVVIASIITISLASVDFDSMINAQFGLFGCLLLACLRFCFVLHNKKAGIDVSQPQPNGGAKLLLGNDPLESIGPTLFNFAFVVTAPALSCGANGIQSAIKSLCTACVIMGSLYAALGWVGASAVAFAKDAGDDTNLLSLILHDTPSAMDIVSVMVFFVSQLAAIPVYCELARETLETHILPPSTKRSSGGSFAFYLCHAAPWLICAVTYNSTLFESFVEWSSLLLLGFCNFSLPLLLDILIKQNHMSKASTMIGGNGGTVLWVFSFTTAAITAVILQRMTGSLILAEAAFMIVVLACMNHF